MHLFRSLEMGYYSLVMPRESSWEVMNKLGDISAIQFVDLNPGESTFTRPYANYIKRCDDMEMKLKFIESEMEKFDLDVTKCTESASYLRSLKIFLETRGKAEHSYFEEVEAELEEKMQFLSEQVKTYENLIYKHNELTEYKNVLQKTKEYILGLSDKDKKIEVSNLKEEGGQRGPEEGKLDYYSEGTVRVSFLSGTVNTEDSMRFKRLIFRVTRGNTWTILKDIEYDVKQEEEAKAQKAAATAADKTKKKKKVERQDGIELPESLIDPITGAPIRKCVFLVVYQGGENHTLKNKLTKICDSFGATRYAVPENDVEFLKKSAQVAAQIADIGSVVKVTKTQIRTMLENFQTPRYPNSSSSYVEELRMFLLKEKTIYHNLNLLRLQASYYEGYLWAPLEDEHLLMKAMQDLVREKPNIAGGQIQAIKKPEKGTIPTHFKTREFTWPFQEIVNTYGVPRYREVNPGLFTCATFPFLFGVMFGDICHGGMLFVLAGLLVWKTDELKAAKSPLMAVLKVRYFLLFMGGMALYAGFIYNDFASIPLDLFGTCWYRKGTEGETAKYADCTYPFGVDPKWYIAQNELNFINSLKMKLAVILGVAQMLLGIFLKASNAIHFNAWLDFIFEFIPQLLFMLCTFGYMIAAVFVKWAQSWPEDGKYAPSIISMFIEMFFKAGAVDPKTPLYGDVQSQANLQSTFFWVALLAVPVMLIPKPILLLLKHSAGGPKKPARVQHELKERLLGDDHFPQSEAQLIPHQSGGGGHGHGEEFEFGEVLVHQVIETIEFVLGSVSHTASYLRLWALSLAHAELARVFFEKTVGEGIVDGNFLQIFLGFPLLLCITIGILLGMDVMECSLHALRLHWVEFQSKFYKADGVKFEPFSFENALQDSIDKNA